MNIGEIRSALKSRRYVLCLIIWSDDDFIAFFYISLHQNLAARVFVLPRNEITLRPKETIQSLRKRSLRWWQLLP
ncbi:MAG: hypothetical protein ACKO96_38670, partial [Flammeovirgaceae bacterium]